MDIRVLGPVEVFNEGTQITIEGAQQQCVLGLLAAYHGSYVPVDRLIGALWEDEPPKTAKTIVQLKVSQLRKTLAGRISTSSAGYALEVPEEEVDVCRFRRLAAEGQAAGDPQRAAAAWERAIALWRGQPLQGLGTDWVERRVRVPLLAELWDVLEHQAATLIELGRHREVPALLRGLRDEEPLRETPHALAMTALWHDGRTAEALELFHEVQRLMAGELGVDPGPRLRDLHQRIVEGHRPVVPRQLPRDVPGFVGRAEEAGRLRELLRGSGVAVVTGPAGIGKSALAVRVGHQLAGEFPDGQLHVDLGGYGHGGPLQPERVLPRLLGALGVPVPGDPAEQLDLYRSTLATRRVLIVLDNAASADQVRPLLPGGASCAVLVTSRDTLRGLALQGAGIVRPAPLTPGESGDLLAGLVGGDLIGSDPEGAAELAELCGHLPLALAIAGANLIGRDGLRAFIDELHADRLNALAVEGDAQATVAAAFAGSYAALAPDARTLFRRLGLVPGCDVTAASAARLAGGDPAAARRLLAGLASAHLVEEHMPGRYRVHDLVGLYARGRCEEGDDPAALHAYYLHTARAAGRRFAPWIELLPLGPDDPPRGSDDPPHDADEPAGDWFEAEQHNLLAVIEQARGRMRWRLAETLRAFTYTGYHPRVVISVAGRVLDETERAGDLAGQAAMHHTLAGAWFTLNEPRPAARHCELAAELYERVGWRTGVLVALSNLVVAGGTLGDLHEGLDRFERVVRLWEAHDPSRLPALLENFAIKLMWAGLAREALEQQSRAVRLREEHAGNQPPGWRGRSYSILGDVYLALGDLGSAMEAFERGLAQAEGGELAAALSSAAIVAHHQGDGERAAALARRAVQVATSGGMVREYEEARSTLARVDGSMAIGERIRVLTDVLDYYRDRTYPYIEVRARVWLAAVLLEAGHLGEAASLARDASGAAARHGLRRLEGQALTLLARACPPGHEHARRAADLHHAYGHRLDEAAALAVLDQT